MVGEVFNGDPAMIRFFEGTYNTPGGVKIGVDYLFDFPLDYPIRDAFIGGRSMGSGSRSPRCSPRVARRSCTMYQGHHGRSVIPSVFSVSFWLGVSYAQFMIIDTIQPIIVHPASTFTVTIFHLRRLPPANASILGRK